MLHEPSGPADSRATLIRPEESSAASRRSRPWSMPPDLLADATKRLRAAVLIYALGFFLAGLAPALVFTHAREMLFASPAFWLPPIASITGALGIAALITWTSFTDRAKLRIGLGFEVLGSFGIAAAEYQGVTAPIMGMHGMAGFGLSWVVTWVLLFSVVVPTPPVLATIVAICSVAAVPVTYAAGVSFGLNVPLAPEVFFFSLVFPYLVVVVMVWTASYVVYGLGTAVRKARELGSYRLERRLGQGGMGEVWRARHRMLARPAAIKLIRPEFLGPSDARRHDLIERFEREAQATALLRSPHTVAVYDFGTADDGTFYYVMELLDGFDLDELVTRFGPMPPERVVYLLRQVAESLAEAHEAGLIHRDVKPANLYACRYGREVDFMKVLDFGLVKTREPDGPVGSSRPGRQVAGGTPAFMSPEQVLGDEAIDARTDIYALGCVAYWLLTGQPVFTGTTPMDTMMKQVSVEPEPPSKRTAQPIPPVLEAIVMRCLAKESAHRPQSADELRELLEAVPLRDRWTEERAQDWWNSSAGK